MAALSSILSVKSSPDNVNHRDTIRSDRSNSRRGHTSLWDIERGRGKREKPNRELEKRFTAHYSAERWQDDEAAHTGWISREREMHVQTHAYV